MNEDTDKTALLALELLVRIGNVGGIAGGVTLSESETFQPQAGINELMSRKLIYERAWSLGHKTYGLTELGQQTYDFIKEPLVAIYKLACKTGSSKSASEVVL